MASTAVDSLTLKCTECQKKMTEDMLLYCSLCDATICGICYFERHQDKETHNVTKAVDSLNSRCTTLLADVRNSSLGYTKLQTLVGQLEVIEHLANQAKEIRQKLIETNPASELTSIEQNLMGDTVCYATLECSKSQLMSANQSLSAVSEKMDELLLSAKRFVDELQSSLTTSNSKKIFIIGGSESSTKESTSTAPNCQLPSNFPLGISSIQPFSLALSSECNAFERLSPINQAYSQSPLALGAGCFFQPPVIGVADNQVFTFGSSSCRQQFLGSVERFDTESGEMVPMAPLLIPRRRHASASLGSFIYVCGGCNKDRGGILSSCERYCPAKNAWEAIANMNTGRMDFSVVPIEGKLFSFGGLTSDGSQVVDSVEVYNPVVNTWTTLSGVLSRPRHMHTAIGVDVGSSGDSVGNGSATSIA